MENDTRAFISVEHEVIYHLLKGSTDLATPLAGFAVDGDLGQLLQEAQGVAQNTADRPILSWRKTGLGNRVVTFVKRCIRKLLRWYINPVVERQNEFNKAAMQVLVQLAADQEALRDTAQNQIEEATTALRDKMDAENEKMARQLHSMVLTGGRALDVDFNAFQKMTYAQSGEDSILHYVLHVLGFQDASQITYMDLGANDPVKMNNTYSLYMQGARGILVDANPDFIEAMREKRPEDTVVNGLIDTEDGLKKDFYILNGDGLSTPDREQAQKNIAINPALEILRTEKVETITVGTLINRYLGGKAPTVLSIDIEGKDVEILGQIDYEKHRPVIIITEMIDYSARLAQPDKSADIQALMAQKGYVEYAFTGINSLFVDGALLKDKGEQA